MTRDSPARKIEQSGMMINCMQKPGLGGWSARFVIAGAAKVSRPEVDDLAATAERWGCSMSIHRTRRQAIAPRIRKNPFLSMWLSAANRAANTGRGALTAAARRQQAAIGTEATKAVTSFWTSALGGTASRGKAKRK